jgi:hypothetical protein
VTVNNLTASGRVGGFPEFQGAFVKGNDFSVLNFSRQFFLHVNSFRRNFNLNNNYLNTSINRWAAVKKVV